MRSLDADSWVYSANKVNLKPSTRVPFNEWCERIKHYLQGGESSFKPEVVHDAYTLLSPFWHGMEPDEKKLAFSITTAHEHAYSVACVKDLMSKLHVPVSELQNLRVALELAVHDPSHLERGKPEAAPLAQPAEVQAVQANRHIGVCQPRTTTSATAWFANIWPKVMLRPVAWVVAVFNSSSPSWGFGIAAHLAGGRQARRAATS